jgi:hypothetical protein
VVINGLDRLHAKWVLPAGAYGLKSDPAMRLFPLVCSLTLFICFNLRAADELDFVGILSKDADTAKRLGVTKLNAQELAEWYRILNVVYRAGGDKGQLTTSGQTTSSPSTKQGLEGANAPKAATSRLWLSKADLNGDDVIVLNNGAVFKISFGFVGIGLRRNVGLIQEGRSWSLLILGKRIFRGELVKPPEVGQPVNFRRASISEVSAGGSIITMLDGSIFEIDAIGRIETALWLPVSDVLILDGEKLVHVDGLTTEVIQAKRLK